MIEWKDLETKYGWLLDIERTAPRKMECKIDFDTIYKKVYSRCKEKEKNLFTPIEDWELDLLFAIREIREWGPKVGYIGDYETFGEFSRRYTIALDKVEAILKVHENDI